MTTEEKYVKLVSDYIRENVKRPRGLPRLSNSHPRNLRWRRGDFYCCPLGLLDSACVPVPVRRANFTAGCLPRKISDKAILFFFSWWDIQTDARKAVDAVWGRRKK